MKKSLIVLLVMVLAAGFAFAGSTVTGKFKTSFTFDLDAKDGYFTNTPYAKLIAEILADTKKTDNAGAAYAELSADFGVRSVQRKATDGYTIDSSSPWMNIGSVDFEDEKYTAELQYKINFKSAKIVGENWNVSILKTAGSSNFATSTIDTDIWYPEEGGYYDSAKGNMAGKIGVTTYSGVAATYDAYTFGFGYKSKDEYNVSLKAADVAVADVLKASAGVAYSSDKKVSFGAKATVAIDAATAVAAGDFCYDLATEKLSSEASLAVVVKAIENVPVTFDAYWLDNATVYETKNSAAIKDVMTYYGYECDASYKVYKVLTAKATANVEGFDVTVKGKDLLKQKIVSGDVAYTYDAFDFDLSGNYGIRDKKYEVELDVTYNQDLYTATVELAYDSADGFCPDLYVESTTLVSGATLYAGWTDAAFGKTTTLGSLYAGCSIAF